MCLDRLNKRISNHKFGYKLYRKIYRKRKSDCFMSRYPTMSGNEYQIGKKYNAFKNGRYTDSTKDGESYQVGFHYYLRLKDAKAEVNKYSSSSCIVRIIPSKILACGLQYGLKCGVSQYKVLDKIMFDPFAENKKKFLKLCKGETQQYIIKFIQKYIPDSGKSMSVKEFYEFGDFVFQSESRMLEYIDFVDFLPKTSKSFKSIFSVNFFLMNNEKYYDEARQHFPHVAYSRKLLPYDSASDFDEFLLSLKTNTNEIL